MPLLAAKLYDPAIAVSKSTASLLPMTALDTTNLRNVFTVPPSGNVLVRMQCVVHGATTFPVIMLGVLQSAVVKGRVSPRGHIAQTALATSQVVYEAVFCVTGLVAGASLTWDAAYGVEIVLASTGIKYGGPDNSTTNDAFGGFAFEIWSA